MPVLAELLLFVLCVFYLCLLIKVLYTDWSDMDFFGKLMSVISIFFLIGIGTMLLISLGAI